ncbi:TonB-dependent receptor plug domain-containing protein [Solitalea canadensis]|uniref:Outer membrane cobalamin receptor protein n=1 Tax=Solitalea canadensis (strain ATCC 29591 / DSM 3403 / JCM 21819 / LMG 8368 / NBRC 15130 / NCIMB 12057 / USAM 9D) TaxID=929556 RepID=H8KVJ6_SOLCM|nr:TonB-dependent receptor [Solitalea canadensis]AFD06499.1 outer membrane cobalamin receptor protein [Solitalea canadensis DSM 3403]
MKKTFTLFALTVTTSLVAYSQEKKLALDEVTVTATKFAKKQSETGKVVSVISREELERSSGKSILDILNIQPSLNFNNANGNRGGNISTYLRGSQTGNTLILIDGIPVNDPSQITNDYDLNLIAVDMIDHIEILKGGHSTLYGSDAVAGVINIITKKGGAKPFNINALVTAGSYKDFKESLGISGSLSRVDYNFSVTHEYLKGFSAAKDTVKKHLSDEQKFDDDHFKLQSLNFNMGIKATENLMIRPFVRYSKTNMAVDYGAFTDDRDYTGESSDLSAGFSSNLKIKSSDLFLNYNYSDVKRSFLNDSIAGPKEYSSNDTKGLAHNVDLYGRFLLVDHLELLTGGSFRYANTNQANNSISQYGVYKTELNSDSAKNSLSSLYASVFLKDIKGFNLELGGRFNYHSIYGNNFTYTINPSLIIEENTKVFVNISSAFKIPTLYQLYAPVYGNPNLNPEKVQTFEAGFQTVFADGKAKLGLNAFKRKGKDVIAFTTKYVNYNKQDDQGMEVEGEVEVIKDLSVKASYALVYGKVTTATSSFNNLYRMPRNSFIFNAGYKVTDNLFISTNLKVVGQRVDPYFDTNTFQSVNLTLDKYFLLDAYAEYKFKMFKVFVDFRNITNEQYTEITGYNTRGFNLNGGLSFTL